MRLVAFRKRLNIDINRKERLFAARKENETIRK